MPGDLCDGVAAFLSDHGLLQPDTRIVVAVSGGPDSVALVHLLWRISKSQGTPSLHIAHLDHGFRGAQSAAEAMQVSELATQLTIPSHITHINVAQIAKERRQNRQAAARAVRYSFLARTAQDLGAQAVATGHQANDQAETVLFHLLRGAGTGGLRGMKAVVPWSAWRQEVDEAEAASEVLHTPQLIRPLLNVPRAALEAYCHEHNLPVAHDPSNVSPRYTRSQIRHQVMPMLERYNPRLVEALCRTAIICGDDYDELTAHVEAAWQRVIQTSSRHIVFDTTSWAELSDSIQRGLVRKAIYTLEPFATPDFERLEGMRQALGQGPGHHFAPDALLLLSVEHGRAILAFQDTPALINDQFPCLRVDSTPLTPGSPLALGQHWTLYLSEEEPTEALQEGEQRVALDAKQLGASLLVRHRRQGDRLRPLGGKGSRRIQDMFVDAHIPASARTHWPLLATPDAVVWIIGMRLDERFAANAQTTRIIWASLRKNH